MSEKITLEIRHRIWADGSEFIVSEVFGKQPELIWRTPSREFAEKLVAERRAMLSEMVASISTKAREAVEDARDIDNLKAGNA